MLDRDILPVLDTLKAGVVSTVAGQALELSGPGDIDSTNQALEATRKVVSGSIIEEIAVLICRAFPSYTPEDVDQMTWPTILKRVVQAESVLLQNGILKQPLYLGTHEPEKPRRRRPVAPVLGEIPQGDPVVPPPPPVSEPTDPNKID